MRGRGSRGEGGTDRKKEKGDMERKRERAEEEESVRARGD